MNHETEGLIEDNVEGELKDFKYSYTAKTSDEALKVFEIASQKLVEVHNWDKWAGGTSAKFVLANSEGFEILREPKEGDFIRIDIPGPGTKAGEGYDWVKIERVVLSESENGQERTFGFKVRPSANPHNPEAGTAHFLTDKASSYFIVSLKNRKVCAEIHGRNESPNLETKHVLDKARNAGVAVTAILGIANIQWSLLAQGLLK